MNRISILLASAAFATAASSAMAADAIVPYEEPAPAPIVSVYDWTGVYVGVQGGYVWTNLDMPGGVGDEDFNGPTLGIHAGANWQNGNIVFGVEGDINYTWNSNEYLGGAVEIGTDWAGSLRGRLGYALDRTLLYGTAGLAFTNGYIDGAGFDESETFVGWTAGVGVEHAFTDNWSARIEYRYSDYGSEDFGLGLGDFDLTEHALRVGVSFKF